MSVTSLARDLRDGRSCSDQRRTVTRHKDKSHAVGLVCDPGEVSRKVISLKRFHNRKVISLKRFHSCSGSASTIQIRDVDAIVLSVRAQKSIQTQLADRVPVEVVHDFVILGIRLGVVPETTASMNAWARLYYFSIPFSNFTSFSEPCVFQTPSNANQFTQKYAQCSPNCETFYFFSVMVTKARTPHKFNANFSQSFCTRLLLHSVPWSLKIRPIITRDAVEGDECFWTLYNRSAYLGGGTRLGGGRMLAMLLLAATGSWPERGQKISEAQTKRDVSFSETVGKMIMHNKLFLGSSAHRKHEIELASCFPASDN